MTPLRILSRDTDFAARNSLVGIEHLTDEELQDIRHKCEQRAKADQVAKAAG